MSEGTKKRSKYSARNLVPMFRKAAALRNEMCAAGFTDNGGAIHSAERILDLLGQRVKYPGLGHINNLRLYRAAEFSSEALRAHKKRQMVLIEHVAPIRELTRAAIGIVDGSASDKELLAFVKKHYRLVLLTAEQAKRLNKQNRSKMVVDRLAQVGITTARVEPT